MRPRRTASSPVYPEMNSTGRPASGPPAPRGELLAAHAGHHHVGDHQVRWRRGALGQLQRVEAVARLENGVAVLAQEPGEDGAHRRLVLRHENGFASPARDARRRRSLGLSAGTRQGQVDLERGALPRLAVDRHESAALLDDAVHRGEAEAGALAHALGGEERLEDVPQRLRIHAGPGVGDEERRHIGRARPDPTCLGARACSPTATFMVSMVSVPPSGMASRALSARLSSTWSSCPGSALTWPRSLGEPQLDPGDLAQRPLEDRLERA